MKYEGNRNAVTDSAPVFYRPIDTGKGKLASPPAQFCQNYFNQLSYIGEILEYYTC